MIRRLIALFATPTAAELRARQLADAERALAIAEHLLDEAVAYEGMLRKRVNRLRHAPRGFPPSA